MNITLYIAFGIIRGSRITAVGLGTITRGYGGTPVFLQGGETGFTTLISEQANDQVKISALFLLLIIL
jgi:hypothetical protein